MASASWVLEDVSEFVDDKKRGVIGMACDEELIVVGLSGWSGTARVYNISTGELKTTLLCNKLSDKPAPFSHDNVLVWLSNNIIVTVGISDNTLSIWDREGNLLAQDLHKNKESMSEKERIKAMDPDEREQYLMELTAGMSEEEAHHTEVYDEEEVHHVVLGGKAEALPRELVATHGVENAPHLQEQRAKKDDGQHELCGDRGQNVERGLLERHRDE